MLRDDFFRRERDAEEEKETLVSALVRVIFGPYGIKITLSKKIDTDARFSG
jgi:hypothetical protein